MKKFLILFLIISMTISLIACVNQSADKPSTPTDNNEDVIITTTSEISSIVTTTVVATKKEGTPQNPLGDSYSGGDGTPPITVVFESVQDINPFIEAANGTEAEFEAYAEKTELYSVIDQKVAQAVAHNMEIIYLPVASSKLTDENSGAYYNVSSNTLHITYNINGNRYRFIFWFNKNEVPDITTVPVYKEAEKLGETSFTLYEGDGCLFGYLLDDSVRVELIIYTDNFESVSLNAFSMVPVASVK